MAFLTSSPGAAEATESKHTLIAGSETILGPLLLLMKMPLKRGKGGVGGG